MKNPWQTTAKLPYDSSGDDDDDDDGDDMHVEDTDGDQSSKSTSHLDELFFFHPDDPKLANRINGELFWLEYRVLFARISLVFARVSPVIASVSPAFA